MPIPGESLLAAVGLTKFLEPGAVRITGAIQARADKWADGSLMRREIKRFLAGDEGEEIEPAAFDYKETLERLVRPISADDIAESVTGISDADTALDFIVCASRACDYLSTLAPRRTRNGIMGPRPVDPDDLAIAAFRRTYTAVNDPSSVLANLRAGTLSSAEVKALISCYPEIYETIRMAVFDVLADMGAAKGPTWEPPTKVIRGLETLLATRTLDKKLQDALQAHFQGEDQTAEKPAGKPLNAGADSLVTPTQKIAQK